MILTGGALRFVSGSRPLCFVSLGPVLENQWSDETIPVYGHDDHVISSYMVIVTLFHTAAFIDNKVRVIT